MAAPPRAELRGISKRFAATQALDGRLARAPARRGPRAGRRERRRARARWSRSSPASTSPTAGRSGSTASRRRSHGPAHARALGIAVVHQEPRLFPDLTVAENVFIGHAPSGSPAARSTGAGRAGRPQALFEELDVQFDVGAPVRGLSMADQQLIEIAKALSVEARVLILDEPTASLSAHEVERLFTIVRRLRDRGVADPVRQPPARRGVRAVRPRDRLPRRPARHHRRATSELTTADLVRHMVGRTVSLFPKVETPVGDVLLEVDGLTRVGVFRDVAFSVRAGEIVGFAGLVGAGRTEVARVLFGIDRRDGGEIRLGGTPVDVREPVGGDARRASPTCPRTATRRASSWTSRSPRT